MPKLSQIRSSKFLDNYNKEQTKHSYIRLGIERYGDIYLHSNFDKHGNYQAEEFNTSTVQYCCHFYFTDRMYQLHESYNCKIYKTRQGNWCKKSSWRSAVCIDKAIYR